MINNLLDSLYNKDIQLLTINNQKIKLVYQKEKITTDLKNEIKENKQKIIERLQENDKAKQKGFNVYGHGELYEYRYGFESYLFIERLQNGLVAAWRANYPRGNSSKPYKKKTICPNSSFERAFKDATGFIDWLNKKK
ncbi:hypothetical protein [Paraliobacillus sp. X-1268]|uniref:TubC N-terminal docking domain-related protein n=1 Tax=Paraliobacillus sp. X-1268 TaxID=2213193 RepID=UPI000E3BA917|nr:hypothetical protein [Paraliobacillus sp. X-1268]